MSTDFALEQRPKGVGRYLPSAVPKEGRSCPHSGIIWLPKKMTQKSEKIGKTEIENIFSKGRGNCCGEVCVRFLKNSRPKTRIAFICGKKNVPLAVRRNLIRRRMREGVKHTQEELVPGWDILFIFRGKTPGIYQKMRSDIETLLRRDNLLKISK